MEEKPDNTPELKPAKKDKLILWSILAGLIILLTLIFVGIGF